jgi:hypothetical protein
VKVIHRSTDSQSKEGNMAKFMNRRRFLELSFAAGPLGYFTHHAFAQAAEKKTHTYKTVDKLHIQADVYSSKVDRRGPR